MCGLANLSEIFLRSLRVSAKHPGTCFHTSVVKLMDVSSLFYVLGALTSQHQLFFKWPSVLGTKR